MPHVVGADVHAWGSQGVDRVEDVGRQPYRVGTEPAGQSLQGRGPITAEVTARWESTEPSARWIIEMTTTAYRFVHRRLNKVRKQMDTIVRPEGRTTDGSSLTPATTTCRPAVPISASRT